MCCVHPKQNKQTSCNSCHPQPCCQTTTTTHKTSFKHPFHHTHTQVGENEVQGLLLLLLLLFWLCTTLTTSFTRPPHHTTRNTPLQLINTSLSNIPAHTINNQQTHTPHALKIPMRANSLHIQSTTTTTTNTPCLVVLKLHQGRFAPSFAALPHSSSVTQCV